jgi:predicted HD superfamily hydrolase involved in NAD metabolism
MTASPGLHTRLWEALDALPKGLREHILRVEEEALRLAALHNVEASRASISALGHDLVRHLSGPELLDLAQRYDLTPDAVELAEPILVHGPVAARMLSRDFGVEDAEVLAGVDCHTTARAGMAALEKVLFVADKVEPHKREREPVMVKVRDAASSDLDAGVLRYLDWSIEQALHKGWLLHPRTLEARNWLLSNK